MKIDQLQYFVEAAKREHLGQAARFLRISPSAISHSIAALEEEFGKPLFIKQGRQIKLTTHGKILLDRAQFLLAEMGRIKDEIASDEIEMRGHFRLASTHTLSAAFLTPAWMELQKENPSLTATIHSLRSGEVLSRVSSGEVDLGVCFSPHAGPNHEQETLYEGKLVICFGNKHPFLKERRTEDLEKFPHIVAAATTGIESCENHPAFQRLGIVPKVNNYFDSYDVALSALRAQTVWALLPDIVAASHRKELETFVPRGWKADYKICAVWPRHRIRTRALDSMVERLRQAIQTASRHA